MKRYQILSALLLLLTSSIVHATEEWAVEEVLQQLSELRRDHNQLRQQVESLSNELNKLKGNMTTDNGSDAAELLMGEPEMGRRDAPLIMIEFTDYQCPFCSRHVHQTMPQLIEKYVDSGRLLYTIKDFPLGFHKKAKLAAVAANCAGEQGAYWPMHKKLFSSDAELNRDSYLQYAADFSLDKKAFETCLSDPAKMKEIEEDMAFGQKMSIRGTPAFLLGRLRNGKVVETQLISGAQSVEAFSNKIDSYQ